MSMSKRGGVKRTGRGGERGESAPQVTTFFTLPEMKNLPVTGRRGKKKRGGGGAPQPPTDHIVPVLFDSLLGTFSQLHAEKKERRSEGERNLRKNAPMGKAKSSVAIFSKGEKAPRPSLWSVNEKGLGPLLWGKKTSFRPPFVLNPAQGAIIMPRCRWRLPERENSCVQQGIHPFACLVFAGRLPIRD